ncbi:hypothetical protein [Parabacteroides leei]|uniref:hypothetical protein n=1 Tax=Parabacteroides leei TaxID=2939491 RepID=UPI001899445F|nr:hypothetical protein [Parabacteroides goldsteinii]
MQQSTITTFKLRESIADYAKRISKALKKQNFALVAYLTDQRKRLEEQLANLIDEERKLAEFEQKASIQDKTLRSFAGKLLALTIADVDMAVIHLDMYMSYFKEMGYVQRSEWKHVHDQLRKAINDFRNYNTSMFDKKTAAQTGDLTNDMELAIRKSNLFTDREMQHYTGYFDKVAEN